MSKKTLHLVFQTHWDREWYFTFETYRMRLIHVIKRVIDALDQNEIDRFVLDGQTLPLEDFLAVAEEIDKTRLFKWLASGKIVIGPWYIAMDEFLVQGESIIRNLEIGQKTAETYGKNQKYGYLPDTFGHVGQMPQILKNFDIHDAMMWRGIESNQSECIWEGIDGSRLFTIYLSEGYYQPLINQVNFVKDIKNYIDTITPRATTQHLLLTAGGDHLMPIRESLLNRINALKETYPDIEFKVNDYIGYTEEVKKAVNINNLTILRGELNSNQRSYILPNVWSTRSYLKINNQKLEDLMIGLIEPMIASIYLYHQASPSKYIESIWRLILENQPHDSICGCSVDDVHLENEMRSKKAFQMINALQKTIIHDGLLRSLDYYQKSSPLIESDDSVLMVFNPNVYPFSGYIQGDIYLHQHHEVEAFDVINDRQERFNVVVESSSNDRLFESPLDYPPFFRSGKRYRIHIEVKNLKPISWQRLSIVPKEHCQPVSSKHSIENDFIRISLESDGTLTVTNLKTHEIKRGIHQFYSSLDAGDTYNYSKPINDLITKASLHRIIRIESDDFLKTMSYQLQLIQPAELSPDRKSPSQNLVNTLIDVKLHLYQNDPLCYVHLNIDQKAKDQRLRVKFPLQGTIDTSYADSAYEIKHNRCNREEFFVTTRLKEVPVVVDHSLSMIRLDDLQSSVLFIHRGLHEYQTVNAGNHTDLEVTLVRSVSHLSRDDFGSRGGAAGPNLSTPDAQSVRIIEMDYGFGFYPKDYPLTESVLTAQSFRKPPMILKGHPQDEMQSLIELSNRHVIATSVRLIREKTVELRLWNPLNNQQKTSIESEHKIQSLFETQMNHQNTTLIHSEISLHPHEIKTIIIQY